MTKSVTQYPWFAAISTLAMPMDNNSHLEISPSFCCNQANSNVCTTLASKLLASGRLVVQICGVEGLGMLIQRMGACLILASGIDLWARQRWTAEYSTILKFHPHRHADYNYLDGGCISIVKNKLTRQDWRVMTPFHVHGYMYGRV